MTVEQKRSNPENWESPCGPSGPSGLNGLYIYTAPCGPSGLYIYRTMWTIRSIWAIYIYSTMWTIRSIWPIYILHHVDHQVHLAYIYIQHHADHQVHLGYIYIYCTMRTIRSIGAIGYIYTAPCWKARAVGNNESSEVAGITKAGRRFQLKGHMQ